MPAATASWQLPRSTEAGFKSSFKSADVISNFQNPPPFLEPIPFSLDRTERPVAHMAPFQDLTNSLAVKKTVKTSVKTTIETVVEPKARGPRARVLAADIRDADTDLLEAVLAAAEANGRAANKVVLVNKSGGEICIRFMGGEANKWVF